MSTIVELNGVRQMLLVQISTIIADLKEFTQSPCETVNVEQIKYQYQFVLRQIVETDNKIKTIILAQMQALKVDYRNLEIQLELLEKDKFSVLDLPKYHYSMFND